MLLPLVVFTHASLDFLCLFAVAHVVVSFLVQNFGDLPLEAAKRYGDRYFTAMMLAKVVCVQLVSMLGYSFLFQDVDLVWFKHPLDFFKNTKDDFDVYFQDDGGHSLRYAPYR